MFGIKKLLFFVVVAFLAISFFERSNKSPHSVVVSDISSISDIMSRDQSFRWVFIFKIIEKIPFFLRNCHNGEYIINPKDTVVDFLMKIIKNQSVIRKITIPEGYTVKRILEVLNENEYLIGAIEDIPEEGTLMPDTYFYKYGDSRSSIISKMKNEMHKFIKTIINSNNIKFSECEIITLASIIEKETCSDDEKPIIASVFENRLRQNMRLQSDPTVIYNLSDGYGKLGRHLTKSDLKVKMPHNTYTNNGIPPSPICCPGRKSLLAVINHEKTDYLYFVADGTNKFHRFSATFDLHKENISLRKKEQAQRKNDENNNP